MYGFLFEVYFFLFQVLNCVGHSVNTFDVERPGKNLCIKQNVDCSNQVELSSLSYYNELVFNY